MKTLIGRLRANHGTTVAYLALFIALGGVSYAAVDLQKNSVGSAEIKKNAVKASEIAKNAVGSPEVKNQSLKCTDLERAACLSSADGPGSVVVRSTETTLFQTCTTGSTTNCSSPNTEITARCNQGETAVGGGHEGVSEGIPFNSPSFRASNVGNVERPDPRTGSPTGWTVVASGAAGSSSATPPAAPTITVYALCAS